MKFYKCDNSILCLQKINGRLYSYYVMLNGHFYKDDYPLLEKTNWYKYNVYYRLLSKSETEKLKLKILRSFMNLTVL